jgi:hypothetical protein
MDLEKIKAHREKQAEEFRYAQQTARIVTAINKQTKTITEKLDDLIAAVKAGPVEEAESKDNAKAK